MTRRSPRARASHGRSVTIPELAVLEASPNAVVAVDNRGLITYANPQVAAEFGYDRDEVLGKAVELLLPERVKASHAAHREAYTSHPAARPRGIGLDLTGRRKDGTEFPVEISLSPVDTAVGLQVYATVVDITARKRAEEAIRETSRYARTLIEASLDPLVAISPAGKITDVNAATETATGRTRDELVGTDFADYFTEPERARDGYRQVLSEGFVRDYPLTVRHVSGSTIDVLYNATVYRDERGEPVGVFAAARDISERKRVERDLERLAAAVEQASDGMVITDADGVITYANAAFLAASGRDLEGLLGRSAERVAADMLGPAALVGIRAAAAAAEPWLQEMHSAGVDGPTRHVQVSMTPVRDAAGSPTSFVVVTRDVTDLREAEAEVALQERIRHALADSLRRMPADATLEQAAQALCDELVQLPHVDQASLDIFLGPADVRIIGISAPPGFPLAVGDRLPPDRAALIQDRLASGPWAWYATDDPTSNTWTSRTVAAGLRATAYGPIVHRGQVIGALVIGTFDEQFARILVEKMPGVISFSATSSALLAERLDALRQEAQLRTSLAATIALGAFHPVFQPIVDLASGDVVGYEALTRFDTAQRPDLCFADAWAVGLGPELELATMAAAIDAAKGLPAGLWLDLNLSPRLLGEPGRLRDILREADRPLVLEVTEHDVIEDYEVVREAIRELGHDIRLAVDDAGAGVANFGHIIELRPDLVKLDISLVRRVNANLGRQAMVVAMQHFSRTAGCRLVAEGVETEEEAATLRGLGVDFGQGYHFGHPESAEHWAAPAGPGSSGSS